MGCNSSKYSSAGIGHTGRIPRNAQKTVFTPRIDRWRRRSFVESLNVQQWRRKSFYADSSVDTIHKKALKLPKLDINGHLLEEEVQKRISGSKTSESVTTIGKNIYRYAVLTQQGFYPDNILKPNQDAYEVKHDIGDEEGVSFFAVFDGHGQEGHTCATFAKEKLSMFLDRAARNEREKAAEDVSTLKKLPSLTASEYKCILEQAYVETNTSMREDEEVCDELSGTTAVGAILHGKWLSISNAGDSRAIIGVQGKGNPQDSVVNAYTLSRDQTPYRKDELDRVRAAGARVLTIDQLTNDLPGDDQWEADEVNFDGDIPRLWLQEKKYPGTAFTRSLGDAIAEDIGVIANPEVFTRELTSEDRYIVIASDGIFEFITNQSVIDICVKHSDPLQACKDILKQSYEEWLHYENRTDDMTVICIYLD